MRVNWTEAAIEHLSSIYEYVAQNSPICWQGRHPEKASSCSSDGCRNGPRLVPEEHRRCLGKLFDARKTMQVQGLPEEASLTFRHC